MNDAAAFWSLFLTFEKRVDLHGRRSLDESRDALRQITSKPFRKKDRLFVGELSDARDESTGRLWLRQRVGLVTPSRALHFTLRREGEGCRLTGRLILVRPLQYFIGLHWLFCFVAWPVNVISAVKHHVTDTRTLVVLLLGPVAGVLLLYAYGWFAIFVSRRAEIVAVKIIRNVISDESSAAVTLDLLSSSR